MGVVLYASLDRECGRGQIRESLEPENEERRCKWQHAMPVSALRLQLLAACVGLAVTLSLLTPALAEPQGGSVAAAKDKPARAMSIQPRAQGPRASIGDLCHVLAQAAADNGLPEEFFTRLIWQVSRFDPAAISPAGGPLRG